MVRMAPARASGGKDASRAASASGIRYVSLRQPCAPSAKAGSIRDSAEILRNGRRRRTGGGVSSGRIFRAMVGGTSSVVPTANFEGRDLLNQMVPTGCGVDTTV